MDLRSTGVLHPSHVRPNRRLGSATIAAIATTLVLATTITTPVEATLAALPARAEGPRSARAIASDFRKTPADDPEARRALVLEASEAGPDACRALMQLVRREIEPDLARHRDAIAKAASRILAERRPRRSELEGLRDERAAVTAEGALTKNVILDRADPAVRRLEELLVVSPFDVFDADPEISAAHDALLARGELFDLLEASLAPQRSVAEGTCPEPSSFAEVLERVERLGTVLAMRLSKGDRRTLLANDETAWEIDSGEALGILDLNALRLLLGLRALRADPKLCAAARDHSNDMRRLGFFAHESPVEGKSSFSDRAGNFGTSARSENIANGQRQPAATNRQWFLSPGHHKNMLGNHGRIGLGRSGTYWTQLFG